MSAEILASQWQRIEGYYRDLDHKGLRAFVERIAPVAVAEKIYQGTLTTG